MEPTAHIDFIAASYAAGAIVIGALVAWVSLDYRALRRTLADLELQGFARGSAAARPGPAASPASRTAKEQA
jgi:heme exporter protein CcmD